MRVTTAEMPDEYPVVDRWVIQPGIRLEGENLRFDPFEKDPKKWRWSERPNARLLWDFAELQDANDNNILEYAKKWGVLALCRHGIPDEVLFSYHFRPEGRRDCSSTGTEPLRDWRLYAGIFRKTLRKVEEVRGNPTEAHKVAWIINRMAVGFGHLRPVLVPTDTGELALQIGGSRLGAGLPAALSYQLMVWMTGGTGWLICAECHKWFESRTKRDRGRNAYCPRCGRGAAMRAASRRYYEKNKSKGDNYGPQT